MGKRHLTRSIGRGARTCKDGRRGAHWGWSFNFELCAWDAFGMSPHVYRCCLLNRKRNLFPLSISWSAMLQILRRRHIGKFSGIAPIY